MQENMLLEEIRVRLMVVLEVVPEVVPGSGPPQPCE